MTFSEAMDASTINAHDGAPAGWRDARGGERVVQRRHEHGHADAQRGFGELEDLHDLGHRRRAAA